MQAIEFNAQLNNGIIELPAAYQHWQEGQSVKVIVLATDNLTEPTPATAKNLNHHAGKIGLTQDPLVFQNAIRDEWT